MRRLGDGISYVELAKRARCRATQELGAVAEVLQRGGRWTLEELATVTGQEPAAVRRELALLLDTGVAFTAVDFRRRNEVFWDRLRA